MEIKNKTFMPAQKADLENILSLYRSVIGVEGCTWSLDYPNHDTLSDDFSRNSLFCLKDEHNTIIGVISIDDDKAVESLNCWSKELVPSAELSRLGVLPEFQNQGIARELLVNGMSELKKRGMKSVHFLVCKHNYKAIRSYKKLDFNVVGECRLFDEDWWCYEKAL